MNEQEKYLALGAEIGLPSAELDMFRHYEDHWRRISYLSGKGRSSYGILEEKTKLWKKYFEMDLQHHAPAHTYYVKNGGNDNAAGTSDATAWAHCPGMVGWGGPGSVTLVGTDLVLFRSQDTWQVSSGNWLLLVTEGVSYDGTTYGSGTRAKFEQTGNIGESIIAIYRNNISIDGIETDGNDYVGSGIWVNYNSVRNVDNVTINNVEAHHLSQGSWQGHGIAVTSHSGYHTTNVTITNSYFHHTIQCGIIIYPGWDSAANYVENILVRGCESSENRGGSSNQYGVMIKDDVRNLTVEYCYLHNNGWYGIKFETDSTPPQWTNTHIRYNIIKDNDRWGIWMRNDAGKTGMTVYIYGNLIINNGVGATADAGGICIYQDSWTGCTISIYNNTIYELGLTASARNGVRYAGSTGTINFRNNIVYTDTCTPVYDLSNRFTHSNNLIYRTSGASAEHVYNGTSYNRAGVLTWEPTAQNTDPAFIGGTLPTGFTGTYGTNMVPDTDFFATSAGPTIGTGYTLGTPYNGAINLSGVSGGAVRTPGAFDIGAYQYTGTAPVATLTQGSYRFRYDNADEDEATWMRPQDTSAQRPQGAQFRLRIQIAASGDPGTKQFQIEYKKGAGGTYKRVE